MAVLTPAGRGAVATVAVWGPTALSAVGRLFTPLAGQPLAARHAGRLVLGHWQLGDGATVEEVVVTFHEPHQLEVHCHGGEAASRRILDSLQRLGCRVAPVAQWPQLQTLDRLSAEAWLQLPQATTRRTTAILLDQFRGALTNRLDEIRQWLSTERAEPARDALAELVRCAPLGLHLVRPWSVVLAGKPNTGKSSLANALLGYHRSLVHPTAGTTRDVLTATTAVQGWPLELVDTAGCRAATWDPLEGEGMERAAERLLTADLVVLVTDVTTPWNDEETALYHQRPDRTLVVHNKSDLPSTTCTRRPPGVATSALTGHGLSTLLEVLAGRLVPDPPPAAAPVPFLPRHVAAVQTAREAVLQHQLSAAREALDRLLG